MRILVCIDDTDNMESKGTGELAEMIAEHIETSNWGKTTRITRHQLLVHPDIPYTSHNSSMCFEADIDTSYLRVLIDFAADFLVRESAPESDPGLCVAVIDQIDDVDTLIKYGHRAKQDVMTKKEAYNMAERLGIHLSEHGGTGQGVIGALAGVGLRLSGNDGRFKGKHKINGINDIVTAGEILSQTDIDAVRCLDGNDLDYNDKVRLNDWVKSVLLEGKCVLIVSPTENDPDGVKWQMCPKKILKSLG